MLELSHDVGIKLSSCKQKESPVWKQLGSLLQKSAETVFPVSLCQCDNYDPAYFGSGTRLTVLGKKIGKNSAPKCPLLFSKPKCDQSWIQLCIGSGESELKSSPEACLKVSYSQK